MTSSPLLAGVVASASVTAAARLLRRPNAAGRLGSVMAAPDHPPGLDRGARGLRPAWALARSWLAASGSFAARRSRRRPRVSWELATAIDLLSACFAAGALPDRALAAVATAVDGEFADALDRVVRHLRLGAPVASAWAEARSDPRWATVARTVVRASDSGAPLADALASVAAELRRALRSDVELAVRRAGVRGVVPLGLCFLPAFVLVGVVPVVAGFATALWH